MDPMTTAALINAGVGLLGGGQKTPQRSPSEAIPANYTAQKYINFAPISNALGFQLAGWGGMDQSLLQAHANNLPTQGLAGERSRILGYNYFGKQQGQNSAQSSTSGQSAPQGGFAGPSQQSYLSTGEQAMINPVFSAQANSVNQMATQYANRMIAAGINPDEAHQRADLWAMQQKVNARLTGEQSLMADRYQRGLTAYQVLSGQQPSYTPSGTQYQAIAAQEQANQGQSAMWDALAQLANAMGYGKGAKTTGVGGTRTPDYLE